MDTMKGDVCREEKCKEARREQREDSDRKPGTLKKVLDKIAVPLVAGVMALGSAVACSSEVKSVYPTCDCCDADSEVSDMENENDVNGDMDEEDSELDVPADVPEMEDGIGEDVDEDVTGDAVEEDAAMDVIGEDSEEDVAGDTVTDPETEAVEDVVGEDVLADTESDTSMDSVDEDAVVDVADEDVLADSVDEDVGGDTATDLVDEDTSVDVPSEDVLDGESACGEPFDVLLTARYIATGAETTVGNVTIRYGGVDLFGRGLYDIILCGVAESTLTIGERTSDTATLSDGTDVEITVNTVRAWGSNVFVSVDAP